MYTKSNFIQQFSQVFPGGPQTLLWKPWMWFHKVHTSTDVYELMIQQIFCQSEHFMVA